MSITQNYFAQLLHTIIAHTPIVHTSIAYTSTPIVLHSFPFSFPRLNCNWSPKKKTLISLYMGLRDPVCMLSDSSMATCPCMNYNEKEMAECFRGP